LKRTITKRHKRRVLQKEVLKAMLPDGPPPVPKHKYFKELIKPKSDFGFLFRYIYSINRHAAAQYSFLFFKYFRPTTT
jgi:hypothetical protein